MYARQFSAKKSKKDVIAPWIKEAIGFAKEDFPKTETLEQSEEDSRPPLHQLLSEAKAMHDWSHERWLGVYQELVNKINSFGLEFPPGQAQSEALINILNSLQILVEYKFKTHYTQENLPARVGAGERASSAFFYLLQKHQESNSQLGIEFVVIMDYENFSSNALVVVNRDPGSDLKDPLTWGDDCYICDAQNEEFYTIGEAFKSNKNYFVEHLHENNINHPNYYKVRVELDSSLLQLSKFQNISNANLYYYLRILASLASRQNSQDLLTLPEQANNIFDGFKLALEIDGLKLMTQMAEIDPKLVNDLIEKEMTLKTSPRRSM